MASTEENEDEKLSIFASGKEKLKPDDVFTGLLDYGLFADKVPPCFNSKGLAEFVDEKMGTRLDNIEKYNHDYMRYEALRDSNIPRHLGIPHPEAYAIQSIVIKNHWKTIAEHCNKPHQVFSRLYVRHVGDGRIFKMNYKDPERYIQEEDEQNWMSHAQFIVEADIATCFPSIYTHSIPWALHSVSEAKQQQGPELIGNLLDKCTRQTRDKQTNGLLIGPHASNIISEIILTEIDFRLQKEGYSKVKRYIDDYRFYAKSFEEAEHFIKQLSLELRTYEMTLNEKKTKILSLPRPSSENWVSILSRHPLPEENKEVKFTHIRLFLDRALSCAQAIDKSTPLNYAIKMLAKTYTPSDPSDTNAPHPRNLNPRAKRMYTQEAINLALSYPYLAPILDEYVFTPYWHKGIENKIIDFVTSLINIGLKKLYPDVLSHAIFIALKYNLKIKLSDSELTKIVNLDDCVANVLLLEYSKKNNRQKVERAIKRKAKKLKECDKRIGDKHWLLIYQVWSVDELRGNGQTFLADLKEKNFQFLCALQGSNDKVYLENQS